MARQYETPLELLEQASPTNPPAGYLRLFAKADHKPYVRDSTGIETDLTGPAAGRAAQVTIANTETQIVALAVPANNLKVGSVFRFKCGGLWTNTALSTTSIVRVRFGSTTLTGNIAASVSIACGATARANIPFVFDAMVTVLSVGAAGTVIGFVMADVGNVVAPVLSAPVTVPVVLDTTAAKLIELTYISGLALNSITVQAASVVQEV